MLYPNILEQMNLHSLYSEAYLSEIEPQLPKVVANSTVYYCIGFSSFPIHSAQLFTSVFWVHPLSSI